MAKSRSEANNSANKLQKATGWVSLTWDDLEIWAGTGAVSRGRTYQRQGNVKDLKISKDSNLLATVEGTERYATTVSLSQSGKELALDSACTCFVGISCKHAVATVAEYLEAIADGRKIPVAAVDDKRWAKLEGVGDEVGGDWDAEDDFDESTSKKARGARSSARTPSTSTGWDDKVEEHLRSKSQSELADLACALVRRFPEVLEELRERIALEEGDVGQLVAEARREIRDATSEPAYRHHWNDEGFTPDFSGIRDRFERLLELGHADEVVSLGRAFIRRGIEQASQSDDEGEALQEFSESLPVIFEAVMSSSLSAPKRLLFAIDAELLDDYDAIGSASALVLDGPTKPKDWSKVADILLGRLPSATVGGDEDGFSSKYQRDQLTNWIARALHEAGRGEELLALYETEARTTGSYERLVNSLVEAGRFDDAERWAIEGIAATGEKYPGIGTHLAATLAELARKRNQWDVVAAHAAHLFFDRPSGPTFNDLVQAAKKAGVDKPVRALALSFLETGLKPFRIIAAPQPKTPTSPTKPLSTKRSAKSQPKTPPPRSKAVEPARLMIDETWPLPMLDYLLPLMKGPAKVESEPRPHLEVLLDMAIAAKKPDEVLHWYDKIHAQPRGPGFFDRTLAHADRVAAEVASAFPDRSIEIYLAALSTHLPHAQQSAYESATSYLKKLRPIYEAQGRVDQWDALVASIREKYRNRPRFMELLDRLDGRPIVQSAKPKRK